MEYLFTATSIEKIIKKRWKKRDRGWMLAFAEIAFADCEDVAE